MPLNFVGLRRYSIPAAPAENGLNKQGDILLMTEIECTHCKQFRDAIEFLNTKPSHLIKPYFKVCGRCRRLANIYAERYKYRWKEYNRKKTYTKRESIIRHPCSLGPLEPYEVDPKIMFDPENVECYCDPGDVMLFVGDCHLSKFKFQTLDEARVFRDWAFGLLETHLALTAEREN